MADKKTIPATDRSQLENLPILMTCAQAARIYNSSCKFIRDMCAKGVERGGIKAVKIGGAWRIDRDALLKQLGLI